MEAIDPADVRAALDRVLASPSFVNAGRLSRMLRFVVERTVDGQGDQLKEYLLGVEVFDRPQEYDPRLDSIVRVEARRLRAKLAEYYEAEGAADTLRIRLGKGGYMPTFESPRARPVSPQAVTPSPRRGGLLTMPAVLVAGGLALLAATAVGMWLRPGREAPAGPVVTLAVLPFQVFSGREADQRIADRLADGVTTELARLAWLGVAASTSARQYRDPQHSVREIGRALGVQVVMEGAAHVDGTAVRLEVRLVDTALGRKLWVEEFVSVSGDLDRIERDAAEAAATFLRTRYRS